MIVSELYLSKKLEIKVSYMHKVTQQEERSLIYLFFENIWNNQHFELVDLTRLCITYWTNSKWIFKAH